jgi:hypothetical protein
MPPIACCSHRLFFLNVSFSCFLLVFRFLVPRSHPPAPYALLLNITLYACLCVCWHCTRTSLLFLPLLLLRLASCSNGPSRQARPDHEGFDHKLDSFALFVPLVDVHMYIAAAYFSPDSSQLASQLASQTPNPNSNRLAPVLQLVTVSPPAPSSISQTTP